MCQGMGRTRVVAVVGPTASGKSALAAELCRRFHGEVVSFDSMQIYQGMAIGTAQPTAEEMGEIPHHLIGVFSPEHSFSCAEYVPLARKTVQEIAERGKLPVLCGGTGLYLDSFLRGGSFEETETDPAYREELLACAEREGNQALWNRLKEADPESAETIHPNNVKRVARALEIFHITGKRKSELDRLSRQTESPYDALLVGIRFEDRALLYRRIEERVDRMLADGLVEETRRLLAEDVFRSNATAAQAIGYKELFGYLQGECSLEMAAEELKTATRRYAKRQLTWFGANPQIHWIAGDQNGTVRPAEEIFAEAERILSDAGYVPSAFRL